MQSRMGAHLSGSLTGNSPALTTNIRTPPGLAATTVGRSDTGAWAFFRRLSSRAGKAKAVTATARKIAVLFYNTLRHGMSYKDPGADQYEQQYRSRVLANIQRRAKSLGFVLQAIPGDADQAVS